MERFGAAKESFHLLARPAPAVTGSAVDSEPVHEVAEAFAQDQVALVRADGLGADPGQQQSGKVLIRELLRDAGAHHQVKGAVLPHEMGALALVNARHAAMGRHTAQYAEIGIGLAGLVQPVELFLQGGSHTSSRGMDLSVPGEADVKQHAQDAADHETKTEADNNAYSHLPSVSRCRAAASSRSPWPRRTASSTCSTLRPASLRPSSRAR